MSAPTQRFYATVDHPRRVVGQLRFAPNSVRRHSTFSRRAVYSEISSTRNRANSASRLEWSLNIALNKISGDWDRTKLAELIDELVKTPQIDIESVGFDMPEAEQLIADIDRSSICGPSSL